MKTELNIKLESHVKLIEDVITSAIRGMKIEEVYDLKKALSKCENEYYNRIKLRYITGLGMLGMTYLIPLEVEKYVFYSIHALLQQVPANLEAGSEISIQLN